MYPPICLSTQNKSPYTTKIRILIFTPKSSLFSIFLNEVDIFVIFKSSILNSKRNVSFTRNTKLKAVTYKVDNILVLYWRMNRNLSFSLNTEESNIQQVVSVLGICWVQSISPSCRVSEQRLIMRRCQMQDRPTTLLPYKALASIQKTQFSYISSAPLRPKKKVSIPTTLQPFFAFLVVSLARRESVWSLRKSILCQCRSWGLKQNKLNTALQRRGGWSSCLTVFSHCAKLKRGCEFWIKRKRSGGLKSKAHKTTIPSCIEKNEETHAIPFTEVTIKPHDRGSAWQRPITEAT